MQLVSDKRELLGTEVRISVIGESLPAEKAIEQAFEEGLRIERAYSRFLDGNELARLNRQVGAWAEVSPEMWKLIKFGCEVGMKTGGAFDLTVKSILESWGYDAEYSLKEKERAGPDDFKGGAVEMGGRIEAWSKVVQCGTVELEGPSEIRPKAGSPVIVEEGAKYKVRIGRQIDLGGLGKGYAVDKMVACLESDGLENFFVNAGGDIFARGLDLNGEKWKFFFEHPSDPGQVIGFVNADNFALACSSPSKHKWGNRHHLVDPRTSAPANKMLAVYTQAENCLLADAYATALFVLGYTEARKRVGDFPVEAMLVDVGGEIFRTGGFRGELFTQ